MSRLKPVGLSRDLRKNQTEAERVLWAKLRELRSAGFRFRRQHPIGQYIVDFACLEKKLVIEVDGGQHNEEPNMASDIKRTAWLESEGFRVLRLWDNEVISNIDGAGMTILDWLKT